MDQSEPRSLRLAFLVSPECTGLISAFLLALGSEVDGVTGLTLALCLSFVVLYYARNHRD